MIRKKILCFFGTRPEAIKMAPVVRELKKDRRFDVRVVVSAQHRDMLDQVLKLFKIKVSADLNIMRDGQTLTQVTTEVLNRFEPVLEKTKPDLVLVHGDTTTTIGGALASFYRKIPVGHVEAGLRTKDRYRPFPEEINRRMTDALCSLYFPPTQEGSRNLKDENLNPKNIFVTGNTVIDALHHIVKEAPPLQSARLKNVLKKIDLKKHRLVLLTAHRRENFGRPFKDICEALVALAKKYPWLQWVYPVHPNPHVRKPAYRFLGRQPNIHLLPPLDYGDLVAVMKKSFFVVTDSGGLQEEAPSLGKPVLVLREVTERPEAVRAGTVRIIGMKKARIIKEVARLIEDPAHHKKMANAVNPYGDGRASQRIAGGLRWFFGMAPQKPAPFRKAR
jgi:UDP-N-acetylglucosamine 2-epimerase (non-hydrolysing)